MNANLDALKLVQRVDIDAIVANSFKDYHVKGFDYLCMRRSPTETYKLYFFNGDVTRLPEVVNPHDHRYDFRTWTICGASENVWFDRDPKGERFERFEYRTKLNGGNGFSWAGTDYLKETLRGRFRPGDRYDMRAEDFHTIRIAENETVLMLLQKEDVVPVDKPTLTFTREREPPSLDGLYSRFTADEVVKILSNFEERVGQGFRFHASMELVA